jgi:hypothetical protein
LQNITSKSISHPTSVDVFEENFYWANVFLYDDDSHLIFIATANKFMTDNLDPIHIVPHVNAIPTDVHVVHAALQMPRT